MPDVSSLATNTALPVKNTALLQSRATTPKACHDLLEGNHGVVASGSTTLLLVPINGEARHRRVI